MSSVEIVQSTRLSRIRQVEYSGILEVAFSAAGSPNKTEDADNFHDETSASSACWFPTFGCLSGNSRIVAQMTDLTKR